MSLDKNRFKGGRKPSATRTSFVVTSEEHGPISIDVYRPRGENLSREGQLSVSAPNETVNAQDLVGQIMEAFDLEQEDAETKVREQFDIKRDEDLNVRIQVPVRKFWPFSFPHPKSLTDEGAAWLRGFDTPGEHRKELFGWTWVSLMAPRDDTDTEFTTTIETEEAYRLGQTTNGFRYETYPMGWANWTGTGRKKDADGPARGVLGTFVDKNNEKIKAFAKGAGSAAAADTDDSNEPDDSIDTVSL